MAMKMKIATLTLALLLMFYASIIDESGSFVSAFVSRTGTSSSTLKNTPNRPMTKTLARRSRRNNKFYNFMYDEKNSYSVNGGFGSSINGNAVDLFNANNNNHNNNQNSNKYSFDAMTKFDDRISMMEEFAAPDFLNDYWEQDIRSFSISPGTLSSTTSSGEKRKKRLSVASTVYGLKALIHYPSSSLTRQIIGDATVVSGSGGSTAPTPTSGGVRDQLKYLIHSNWRENDLYEVSLLLFIILKLDPTLSIVQSLIKEERRAEKAGKAEEGDDDETQLTTSTKDRFKTLLEKILTGRPRRRRGEDQQFSAYISYLCTLAYVNLASAISVNGKLGVIDVRKELFDDEFTDFFFKEVTIAAIRSAEIARDELCRQLAYKYSNDKGNFDAIKMAYNLLSYVKATQNLKETTEIISFAADATAGVENIPRINRRLVSSALQVFFDEQDHNRADGLWDRGQPIYKSFNKKGRNVGNAYVFAIDVLGSVLEVLSHTTAGKETDAEMFRPYLPNMERAFEWIERNIDVDTTVVIADKQCDVETGRCYGRALRGWCSPHISPSPGPNAWATAQTITCLARMRKIVKQLLHNDVVTEFGGIPSVGSGGDSAPGWDRLLDSDLGCDGRTIKSVLEERIIDPFIDAADVTNPGVGAAYSTILFGSPGTAKTTIAEAVAEKLGWDFLVIDTSVFLADGLTNFASRIRYVFQRLQSLRRCVILFDEIEEFCLDRENPNLSMESRMLTTAMLTAINDLRRTRQSIFFLATNRLRAFDAAIIRPGRFDMQLFVGTPNLESRVTLFKQALSSSAGATSSSSSTTSSSLSLISSQNEEKAIEIYRTFLESVWTLNDDAMFMNYLESKQYASRIASIVAERNTRNDEDDDDDDGDIDNGDEEEDGGSVVVDAEPVLNDEELSRILSQQTAVMTARGSVRDEYIAQMELSRL